MATLTPFCTIAVDLTFVPIGGVATGMRLDVPFSGTATSPHWDGDRPVSGVDYVNVGAEGSQSLDIRGRIGEGRSVISYRAIGRGDATGPMELLVFETANDEFAHLNNAVAVATGTLDGQHLTLEVSLVER